MSGPSGPANPDPVDDRGQSSVLGVALLVGLVVAGTVSVVAFGGTILSDSRTDAQIESAEHAMTKFDATAALVGLGESDSQRARVSLGGIGESLAVEPDRGWMNVTIVNQSSGVERPVMNRTLGAVVYRNGDVGIAYQGGGVWRNTSGSYTMVSPPEFHYRGTTLTLPLVTVSGGDAASGDLVVRSPDAQDRRYPNTSVDPTFLNPLTDGQVNVTVHSEYYRAWGRFFEQRTSGSVSYDHPAEEVTIELVVPFQPQFDSALVATQPGGVTLNGNCNAGPPDDAGEGSSGEGGGGSSGEGGASTGCGELYSSGGTYPEVSDEVERQVDDCQTDADACKDGTGNSTYDDGETYYFDSGLSESVTVNTTDGNVSLVVNGDYDAGNLTVRGDGTVNVYVLGAFNVDGGSSLNDGGDASKLRVLVHESGAVDLNGNVAMHGLVYAPGSAVDFNGKTSFTGSVVGETITVNGKPSNDIQAAPDLSGVDLGLSAPGTVRITYLYVSSTNVTVSGS